MCFVRRRDRAPVRERWGAGEHHDPSAAARHGAGGAEPPGLQVHHSGRGRGTSRRQRAVLPATAD